VSTVISIQYTVRGFTDGLPRDSGVVRRSDCRRLGCGNKCQVAALTTRGMMLLSRSSTCRTVVSSTSMHTFYSYVILSDGAMAKKRMSGVKTLLLSTFKCIHGECNVERHLHPLLHHATRYHASPLCLAQLSPLSTLSTRLESQTRDDNRNHIYTITTGGNTIQKTPSCYNTITRRFTSFH
jgi:hypothetical protein